MAENTYTGTELVEGVLANVGAEVNDLLKTIMSARVQAQIDAGVDSDTAVAVVMMGMSPDVNTAVGGSVSTLSTSIGQTTETLVNPPVGDLTVVVTTPTAQVENTEVAAGTLVATVTVEDGVTYALTGDDAAMFTLDATTGAITATAAYTPDYETNTQFDFTVTAANASTGETGSSAVVVPVGDLDDVATFTITSDAANSQVLEGQAATYTVTSSIAVTEDTDVVFTVVPAGSGDDQGTNDTNLNDFVAGTFNPVTVTIAAGETTASYAVTGKNDNITELPENYSVTAEVAGQTLTANTSLLDGAGTFTLTTDIDDGADFTGGVNDDTFTGTINGADSTFSALDSLDGGDGIDTLNLGDIATTAAGIDLTVATLTNIETLNIQSINDVDADAAGAALDASSIADLTTLNITKAKDVLVTSATTTDVNVSGAKDGDAGGAKEVFTATITNFAEDTETLTFDGITYTCDVTDTTQETIDGFAAVYNADAAANWTITAKDATTMTFTSKTTGNKTDVVAGDFTGTSTTEATNTLSAAIAVDNQGYAAGMIQSDGGKNVTITDTDAVNDITIGATTVNAGTITVTDADQGAANITIDGGTDVTVTTANGTGTTTIGGTTAATGAVSVTANLTSDGTAALNAGAIAVTGGTTVDLTVNSTSTATVETSNANITNGAVLVVGDANTTAVTVTQNNTTTTFTKDAVAGTTETASVKFGVLKAGDALKIDSAGDDLTFTAVKDLTAEQVAAAFANLTNSDTQSAGGITENGIFTNDLTLWTSATATGDTVVFTSTTADSNVVNLTTVLTDAGSGDGVNATVTTTDGVAGSAAATSTNAITAGAVRVDGNGATASITNVTLDTYAGADLGSTGADLDALSTLSLANSSGAATVATAATTLDLTVNNVNNNLTISTVENLTLTSTSTASTFNLNANAVKNLDITANSDLDISTHTLGAITDLTISGTGAVNVGDISATVETLTASAATGAITATVAGNTATVTTGAGDDSITISTTAIDKAIATAAGDDTVTLAAGTTSFASGGSIDAGEGTADTLSMAAADLTTVTGDVTFQDGISGFERVTVGSVGATDTLDLANLDNISYVNVTAVEDGHTLAISNLAAAGTVNMTGAVIDGGGSEGLSIALADATGDADVLNLSMSSATDAGAITNTGIVTANDIETVNISVSDLFVDANEDGVDDGGASHTLLLSTDSAATINVSGASNLTFADVDTSITLIDASTMTGALTATASNDSETIKGGSANDELTVSLTSSHNTLLGGAGDDRLTGGDLTTLTGGEGSDTFVMNMPSSVNAYSTITDLSSGDVIDFTALLN